VPANQADVRLWLKAAGMNLVCLNRLLTSFFRRLDSGDAVKKSLPKATPSPATPHSNITHASRWPFRNKASVSIKLTSEPGPT
jgi:hypothetical protein